MPDEIRVALDIENDYTPEQEAHSRESQEARSRESLGILEDSTAPPLAYITLVRPAAVLGGHQKK
jgi:hypothetical protein